MQVNQTINQSSIKADLTSKHSKSNKPSKKGISRLLELSGEKKTMLIFSSFLSALASIINFVPYFAGYLIMCEFVMYYNDPHSVDKLYVYWCAFGAIVSIIITMSLNGISFVLSHLAAYRILYNLRLRLAKHLSSLPLGYFTQNNKGQIHKILQENVEKIENFVAHKIPEFIQSLVGSFSIFIVFFIIDWRFGLICVLVYAIAFIIQFSVYYDKDKTQNAISAFFTSLEAMNTAGIEFVQGISAVKMFGKSIFSFQNFAKVVGDYGHFVLIFTRKCMNPYIIFSILANGFIVLLLPLAAFLIANNPNDMMLTLTVLFFIVLSNGIISPILRLFNMGGEIAQISEGVSRIDELFASKPLPKSINPKIPTSFDIAFCNVNFSYQDKENLHNISFSLKQGERLAIVGRSGAGKSTILHLLARFYDVDSGSICIGGVNIKDILESDLMENLSFVFQEHFMFLDTLRENIKAGKEVGDDEVIRAAKLAQCEDILDKYTLDTVVGSNGLKLSGGEAQRINIARAILKNAPILLLDEVNSALDTQTQTKLDIALKHLTISKTVIMVAHKLNAIPQFDKVMLMDNGRIIAFGSHKELLDSNSAYQALWQLHNDTQQWRIEN